MRTLIVVIFSVAFGARLGCAEAIWSSYTKTNRYDFTVTDDEIAGTSWRERDDSPPLAPRKALRAARTRLAELVSAPQDWTLDALCLKELHKGHWVYLAVFQAPLPPGGLEGLPMTICIPVLMNGAAVKAKISAWPR